MPGFGDWITNQRLVAKLAGMVGLTVDDIVASLDSVAWGICTECEDYVTEVEPDQAEGWCEECMDTTVKSCLVLAEVI